MEGAQLSPFPHLSWLNSTFSLGADARPKGFDLRSITHCVSMPLTGQHSVRFIRRGHEQTWVENPGTVHFRPCDQDFHDFLIHSTVSGGVFACFIPEGHLATIAGSEALDVAGEWRRLLVVNDAILEHAMRTLAACHEFPAESMGRADEAARRLVLRLLELAGGGRPDWHDDVSIFDRCTLADLADYIDGHLRNAPALRDMALRVGLSPSHFAKKFRQSTGLSLHRFINRRRIRASLALLQDRSQSLAAVAVDLGFSSQSHFTRLFSDLTGMTPAKYRKQFNR